MDNYDVGIKKHAVEMYHEYIHLEKASSPESIRQKVCNLLKVEESVLRSWLRADENRRLKRNNLPTLTGETKIAQLQREIADLKESNELLRLAAILFAQEELRQLEG